MNTPRGGVNRKGRRHRHTRKRCNRFGGERTAPWTYREFTRAIRGVRNGLGNLDQIDLDAARPGLRRR